MTEILRFGSVGLAATALHLAVAYVAHAAFGADPQAANLAGFLAAVGLSYAGNSRWTFGVEGADAVYMPRFLLLSAIGLMTSASVTALAMAAGFDYTVALLAVGLCVPPMSYLGSKFLVFSPRSGAASLSIPLGLSAAVAVWAVFAGDLLNHDTAWYLVAARKWLSGATLYVDIAEVNPPLGFYLALPAIGLAETFGLSDSQGQVAFVAILTGTSVGWAERVLSRYWTRERAVGFAAAMGLAATLPFSAHFGQREHLLILFILPWLASAVASPRAANKPTSGATAAFAAFGICLKPFFLTYPAFLTLAACVGARSLRPVISRANLVIGALGAAYVAAVFWQHPAWFTEIVPNARATYGAYGGDAAAVLQNAHLPLAAIALVALLMNRRETGTSALTAGLLAALAAYGVQWTGFTYQAGPILALSAIALTFVAMRPGSGIPTLALAAAGAVLIAGSVWETGRYRNDIARLIAPQILERFGPGARIAAWSTSLEPAFPLTLEAQGRWIPTAPALWYLPAALTTCESEICVRLLAETRSEMLRHVTTDCTQVLIVDRRMPYLHEAGVSLDDVLDHDERITTALRQFEQVAGDVRFDILFIKSDAAGC